MTRYHSLLVALHWLMALMMIMALFFGKFALVPLSNADPQKLEGLAAHMGIGIALGVLLVLRLLIRFGSEKPPKATTGHPILDQLGAATHWILYALAAVMVASGLGTALAAGLFPIVYGGSGAPLPDTFNDLAPRVVHGVASTLLLLLVALHFVAALYHQFVLRDGLFSRMWFGKRHKQESKT